MAMAVKQNFLCLFAEGQIQLAFLLGLHKKLVHHTRVGGQFLDVISLQQIQVFVP
jgi:hypothetical protein